MAKNDTITVTALKAMLSYDPETGNFMWLKRPDKSVQWNGRYVGTLAGWFDWKKYRIITIDYLNHRAHRLAWLYMTGEWPPEDIDHINGNPSDNRWINLRLASRSQNNGNTKLRANNTSGCRGVSWDKSTQRWSANCKFNKKYVFRGLFDSFDDAKDAYEFAYRKHFGEFAR